MKNLFLGLLLLPLFAWSADELTKDTFVFEGKSREFINIPSEHLTISQNCLDKIKKEIVWNCEAHASLAKATLFGVPKTRGINKGAFVCKNNFQGRVIIGRDQNNNENSFCEFKDGSIIDNGTLSHYAAKNDHRSSK